LMRRQAETGRQLLLVALLIAEDKDNVGTRLRAARRLDRRRLGPCRMRHADASDGRRHRPRRHRQKLAPAAAPNNRIDHLVPLASCSFDGGNGSADRPVTAYPEVTGPGSMSAAARSQFLEPCGKLLRPRLEGVLDIAPIVERIGDQGGGAAALV